MYYRDFPESDRILIDKMLEQTEDDYGGGILPEELQDDEVFFRTREQVEQTMTPWLSSPGSYGLMAQELFDYFGGKENDYADMEICWLDWACVCRVGDGRYLFWSNSWSDSGLFFQNP